MKSVFPWATGKAFLQRLSSAEVEMAAPQVQLDELRAQLAATLSDCHGPMCERMRWRLQATQDAQELWMLRGEIFQLITWQHCQGTAAQRINAVLPAFEGWLPARMLTRI